MDVGLCVFVVGVVFVVFVGPGIMTKKMRCYSKFKHLFQDMYREDDKPWRYLNVPGARKRNVSPQKVMRRMSLTATGRFVERIG